jgi:cation transport ATPase
MNAAIFSRNDSQSKIYRDSFKQRIKRAIAGGLLVPALALGGALLTGDSSESRWIGEAFVWVIAWPMYLLKSFYPNSEDASDTARIVRLALDLLMPVLVFLAYSSLTYAVLWRHEKQKTSMED